MNGEINKIIQQPRDLRSDHHTVATHAIKRFMERSGCKTEAKARASLLRLLDRSYEVSLEKRYRVIQLINHDFEDAKYYKADGWILVVVENVIVTCHLGEAKRWI